MVGLEDRTGATATSVQQGFVQHFILPLWECMARVHPELQHFVDNAAANAQRYAGPGRSPRSDEGEGEAFFRRANDVSLCGGGVVEWVAWGGVAWRGVAWRVVSIRHWMDGRTDGWMVGWLGRVVVSPPRCCVPEKVKSVSHTNTLHPCAQVSQPQQGESRSVVVVIAGGVGSGSATVHVRMTFCPPK
jgi:hypothetical protein